MKPQDVKRKLTAILSADVEGYSRMMSADEVSTIRTLTAYRDTMTNLILLHRGRVVDAPEDNMLAEFVSVVDAVQCAVEIQRELTELNHELPEDKRMLFRIDVNLGDVVEEKERIYGNGVNIAARLESLCDGGGVCISGAAFENVENKLDLEFEDLGEHQVKNIANPIRVYRVLSYPGAAAHRVIEAKRAVCKKWRQIAFAIPVGLLIVVAAGITWNFYLRPPGPQIEAASVNKMALPLPDKPSIAVLPFVRMLAMIYLWNDRQHDQAIAAAEKAMTLDPNDPRSYSILAETLKFARQPEEVIALMETAMRLNPRYPGGYLFQSGSSYYYMGRYRIGSDKNIRLLPIQTVAHQSSGCVDDAYWNAAGFLRMDKNS